jgi:hypothetical protein
MKRNCCFLSQKGAKPADAVGDPGILRADRATGRVMPLPFAYPSDVEKIVLSPDGRQIATGGELHVAQLGDVPTPVAGTAAAVHRHIEALTDLVLHDDGTVHALQH